LRSGLSTIFIPEFQPNPDATFSQTILYFIHSNIISNASLFLKLNVVKSLAFAFATMVIPIQHRSVKVKPTAENAEIAEITEFFF